MRTEGYLKVMSFSISQFRTSSFHLWCCHLLAVPVENVINVHGVECITLQALATVDPIMQCREAGS